MKRMLILFSVILTMFLTGCNANQQTQSVAEADFKFYSAGWGEDWETVQKYGAFQGVSSEVTDNGHRKTVTIKDMEYLGVSIDVVALVFEVREDVETSGLYNVFLQFEEQNEEALLAKLTELYGERKSSYLDKNGVENPIGPAGWVSSETIEDVLTENEKEYYLGMLPKEYEQTRIDALLRSPLVSIRFDEERNMIEFNGNTASVVAFIKAELQK